MSKILSDSNTTSASTSKIGDYIPVSYNAYDDTLFSNDKINVSFNILFGKGKDSLVYTNERELKEFTNKYQVETTENDDSKYYYIIAEEGPLVIKIDNLDIYSNYSNNYEYALGFAVDFEEPEYLNESHYTPFNVDRDGVMWSIPVKKPYEYTSDYEKTFYQNAKAKYQWTASRAKNMGEELTEEEKELGIEKTTESTGLMYLSFMVLHKEKEVVQEHEITRSISRGPSRGPSCGVTRSITDYSVAGRVGYGHSATSSSVTSTFKYANNTARVVIPIRIRISKDSAISDMNCSKTLKGAEINMERKKILTAPFLP
jgi:hypothetical protein